MGLKFTIISTIIGLKDSFQTDYLVKAFTKLCVSIEPIVLFFSAIVIVTFFNRTFIAYQAIHKSAKQKFNWFNGMLVLFPIVISVVLTFAQDSALSFFFGFTFVSDVLSILYPFVVERKAVIGSFFQITLLMAPLYYYSHNFIYFFWLAIPFSFIKFKNENKSYDSFRSKILAPFILISFLGVFFSYKEPAVRMRGTLAIIAGCFIGLILNE